MNDTKSQRWILLTGIFALACLLWGNNGVRGSDQYWYLSDVETLAQNGQAVSNVYFPGIILRNPSAGISEANPFPHNGPILHFTSLMTKYLGAYNSWAALNIFSHFLIAFCVYQICVTRTNLTISTWVTCLYLISPTAIWQSMNMLQEQPLAGLMALIFFCYVFIHNPVALVFLVVLLAIGTTLHPIFFVLSLFFGLYLIAQGFNKKSAIQVTFGIAAIAAYAFIKHNVHDLFPSAFQPNLIAIITGAVPGKSNILWQLTETPPALTFQLMFSKFIAAVNTHFLTPKSAPFFFYTNLSFIAFLYLVATNAKKYMTLLVPIFITYGLYVAVLLLLQTQVRYQQVVSPIAFTLIALAAYELSHRKLHRSVPVLLFGGTAILGGYLSHESHMQAATHKIENAELSEKLSFLSVDSRLVSYGNNNKFDNRFSYLLKPRKVLIIRPEFLDITRQKKTFDIFEPDFFISSKPIDNRELPINPGSETKLNTQWGSIFIYESTT